MRRERRGGSRADEAYWRRLDNPRQVRTVLFPAVLLVAMRAVSHFNLGTFADRDWAGGYEDPAHFQAAKLDCGQWADVAS